MRLVGLISLSCGTVLDVAMGPYRGKQTGETALLRQLLRGLKAGDVLLADGYYANYWIIALLLRQGVDLLSHHDGKRLMNWRKGQHLGGAIMWYRGRNRHGPNGSARRLTTCCRPP